MARYPHLVDMAWDIVEKLVVDWTKNPYYWEREIDIQAELRSRLAVAYSVLGKGDVMGVKERASGKITYRYSRVACEPSISFIDKAGQIGRIVPDVVVWEELDDPTKHMGDKDDTWPILWACEIKYLDPASTGWDLEKLEHLIDKGRIKYGCWLTFNFDKKISEAKFVWDKHSRGTNLWMCKVRAPEH
jgi:hypothetical protein